MIKKEYWHIITGVNIDEKKGSKVKVGNCISLPYRQDGRVPLIDFDKGKETWRFKVKYIGMIDKDLPDEEKIKRIKQMKSKFVSLVSGEGVKNE